MIYFNIKMVLGECRPKYFDIQMVRGESCSIYLVERSSSSNSTIYSIVPPPPPPNDQAEKLLPKRQLRLANAKSVKARWVGSPAKVTLNGGEKQGKCPPKIPETFRFRNHTNLPRGWTLLLFWFIFVARWGQETRYKWGEMGPLYKL